MLLFSLKKVLRVDILKPLVSEASHSLLCSHYCHSMLQLFSLSSLFKSISFFFYSPRSNPTVSCLTLRQKTCGSLYYPPPKCPLPSALDPTDLTSLTSFIHPLLLSSSQFQQHSLLTCRPSLPESQYLSLKPQHRCSLKTQARKTGSTQPSHSPKVQGGNKKQGIKTHQTGTNSEVNTKIYNHHKPRGLDASIKTKSITAKAICLHYSPSILQEHAGNIPTYLKYKQTNNQKNKQNSNTFLNSFY